MNIATVRMLKCLLRVFSCALQKFLAGKCPGPLAFLLALSFRTCPTHKNQNLSCCTLNALGFDLTIRAYPIMT